MAFKIDQMIKLISSRENEKSVQKKEETLMKRKRFLAVACAAAMIASMTTGLAVNVSAADEKSDFAGEELSILVSAGWMDNRYDETIKRF